MEVAFGDPLLTNPNTSTLVSILLVVEVAFGEFTRPDDTPTFTVSILLVVEVAFGGVRYRPPLSILNQFQSFL